MITTNYIKVRFTLTEEMLGTASANQALHSDYVASKAPDAESFAEEVAAIGVEEATEKGMTIFSRNDDGEPMLWNYQIQGFLKSSFQTLKKIPSSACAGMTAEKKFVDTLTKVYPRKIVLHVSDDDAVGDCERPLRAQTAQGERIALAHSETVPAGTWFEFVVRYDIKKTGKTKPIDVHDALYEAFDRAEDFGLGQWRNSGKGTCEWDLIEEKEDVPISAVPRT